VKIRKTEVGGEEMGINNPIAGGKRGARGTPHPLKRSRIELTELPEGIYKFGVAI